MARHVLVTQGKARQARLVMAGLGSDRFGSARQAWLGKAGMARHGEARSGWAWFGVVRQAWLVGVRRVQVRLG